MKHSEIIELALFIGIISRIKDKEQTPENVELLAKLQTEFQQRYPGVVEALQERDRDYPRGRDYPG